MTHYLTRPESASSRYGQRALENETAKILAAPHGGRHLQIFKASCSIFRLVAGGEVDEDLAHNELLTAGIAVGKPECEIRRILKDARKRGFQQPRKAPENGRYSDRHRYIASRPAPPRREPEPEYQRREILERIFEQGVPVTQDDCVEEWLHRRGINSKVVASEGLATSLPSTGTYPQEYVPHVQFEGEWMPGPVAGIRCLIPFYDIMGERRGGELVRAVVEPPLPAAKSLALKGARARLVMANRIALALLRGEHVEPETVVIVEGAPDYLTAAVESPHHAIFGIVVGSWQPMHAVRIPPGADIIIATDNDKAGNTLADIVVNSLAGRQYGRWRPRGTNPDGKWCKDVNDCAGIGGGAVEWHK